GSKVAITQKSDYPCDDAVKLTVEQMPNKLVAVKCRVPGWSDGVTVRVNGEKWNDTRAESGYTVVERRWKSGDTLKLDIPMPVKLIQAHPRVEQLRNQVAVQRGPVVYCIESHDLPSGMGVLDVHVSKDITLNARYDDLFGGVTVIEGRAVAVRHDWSNKLYADFEEARKRPLNLRLIPYYTWNNRGPAHMTVWLPLEY
ncbi:MAG: glycoside hydrolase family 127 protein, partial [Planctomycetota bacterium]